MYEGHSKQFKFQLALIKHHVKLSNLNKTLKEYSSIAKIAFKVCKMQPLETL